jgi:O-antigen/teichoic acid export membrane protein
MFYQPPGGITRFTTLIPRRLLVNSMSIFGGEAIARIATFLMAVVIARRFGPVALGEYAYALAIASILLLVPDLGLHLFMVREVSAAPERFAVVFWNVHRWKLMLAAGVVAFTLFFGEWGIADHGRRLLFYVLAGRVLLQTFSQASMAIFKAFERMQYVALQQFVNCGAVVVWVLSALALRARLPVVVSGLVVGQIAETCLGWQIIRMKFPPGRLSRWDRKELSSIMLACLPIGGTAILQALNLRIDILVLGLYVPNRELGNFQAAAWFAVGTFLAASLLMSILFPKLSRLLRQPSARGSAYVVSLLKNGFLITALGSLAAWFAAPTMLPLFFGRDLSGAVNTLRILAPVLPLVFLNTVLFYIFLAGRRRFVYMGTLSLGVGVGVVLSFYLSAHYGAPGAAVADVAREFIISAAYLYFLVRGDLGRIAGLAMLKVFGGATALLILGVVVMAPGRNGAWWLAAWMLFVLTGTLFMLGLPRRNEWRLLTDDSL